MIPLTVLFMFLATVTSALPTAIMDELLLDPDAINPRQYSLLQEFDENGAELPMRHVVETAASQAIHVTSDRHYRVHDECDLIDKGARACSEIEADASTSTVATLLSVLAEVTEDEDSDLAFSNKDWSVDEIAYVRNLSCGKCNKGLNPKPVCKKPTASVCGKPLNKQTAEAFPHLSLKVIMNFQETSCSSARVYM